MLLMNGAELKKSFSGDTLFEKVSFSVYDGDKIGLIGVNGAGKSTLFKLMAGLLEPDSGELSRSREVRIGYLEQYAVSDGDRSILDEMLTVFSEVTAIEKELEGIYLALEEGRGDVNELLLRQEALQERFTELDGSYYQSKIKSALTGLGFSEEDFSMPLSQLSGGAEDPYCPGQDPAVRRQLPPAGRAHQPPGCGLHRMAGGFSCQLQGGLHRHLP